MSVLKPNLVSEMTFTEPQAQNFLSFDLGSKLSKPGNAQLESEQRVG